MWLGGHTYFRIDNAPECSVEAKQECCWKRRIFGAERRVGGQECFFLCVFDMLSLEVGGRSGSMVCKRHEGGGERRRIVGFVGDGDDTTPDGADKRADNPEVWMGRARRSWRSE